MGYFDDKYGMFLENPIFSRARMEFSRKREKREGDLFFIYRKRVRGKKTVEVIDGE
jgi:hypothetical protein